MHLIWPIRQHIRLIHERRSRDPACTRNPRHGRCTLTGGAAGVQVTGDPGAARATAAHATVAHATAVHATAAHATARPCGCGPCSRPCARTTRAPPRRPTRARARMRAGPAPPLCRLSDDGSGGATSEDEGQDDREADEGDEDRTARAVDSMAMDAKAAAAADTTAVGSSWRTRWGRPRRRGGGVGHGKLNLWCEAQARKLAAVSCRRANARQARVGRHRAGQ